MIVSDGLHLQLVLNMTIIRIQLVNIETKFMNQIDQLGYAHQPHRQRI